MAVTLLSRCIFLFTGLALLTGLELGHHIVEESSAIADGQLSWGNYFALALIVAFGSFVSGLAGFGFSAVGALSLWLLPAQQVIPWLMGLSLVNQIVSNLHIRKIQPKAKTKKSWYAKPHAIYSIGGLLGLPIGLQILQNMNADSLNQLIGGVLMTYAVYGILNRSPVHGVTTSRPVEGLVGFAGGIIGGFTAFPSAAIVVWNSLQGQDKLKQREIIQPFILIMQTVSLLVLALNTDLINQLNLMLTLIFAPLVVPFTRLGLHVYQTLSDANFKRTVMTVLLVCSISLVIKGLS